jgi:hypothetical protein
MWHELKPGNLTGPANSKRRTPLLLRAANRLYDLLIRCRYHFLQRRTENEIRAEEFRKLADRLQFLLTKLRGVESELAKQRFWNTSILRRILAAKTVVDRSLSFCDTSWPLPLMQPWELLQEMEALHEIFDDTVFHFDESNRKTTYPSKLDTAVKGTSRQYVTIGDVDLGYLQIKLNWQYLKTHYRDPVVSIVIHGDDEYASHDGNPHPHVTNDGEICTGDLEPAITQAIIEGRISLAFQLVEIAMAPESYNPNSVFTSIDEWQKGQATCHECGRSGDEDSMRLSESDGWLCDGCSCPCSGCGIGFCADELVSTRNGDDSYCEACAVRCEICEDIYCESNSSSVYNNANDAEVAACPSCYDEASRCDNCNRRFIDPGNDDECLCSECRQVEEEERRLQEEKERDEEEQDDGDVSNICDDCPADNQDQGAVGTQVQEHCLGVRPPDGNSGSDLLQPVSVAKDASDT